MSGITNKDLEKLSRKFFTRDFLGVFPCDVIPNSKKRRTCVIFNLSKHDEAGSHFVAIIKHERKIVYFDSFGKQCENKYLNKYIHNYKLPIEYNKNQIQDDNSSLCGYYCFYFLYICFLQRRSLTFFINKFEKSKKYLMKNDRKLLHYITKILEI